VREWLTGSFAAGGPAEYQVRYVTMQVTDRPMKNDYS